MVSIHTVLKLVVKVQVYWCMTPCELVGVFQELAAVKGIRVIGVASHTFNLSSVMLRRQNRLLS
jgi:hypothetical protein